MSVFVCGLLLGLKLTTHEPGFSGRPNESLNLETIGTKGE